MAKTILLADDSVTIQKVIELTFMDQDYEVVSVSSGEEALAKLDAVTPGLVIADVHMPGATGYEVSRQVKERLPGVPVLLLVGTFEPFDEGEFQTCGADRFLKKPFDSQELLRIVGELESAAPVAAAVAPSTPEAPEAPAAAESAAESAAEEDPFADLGPSSPAPSTSTPEPDLGASPFDLEGSFEPSTDPTTEAVPAAREVDGEIQFSAQPFEIDNDAEGAAEPAFEVEAEPAFEVEAEPSFEVEAEPEAIPEPITASPTPEPVSEPVPQPVSQAASQAASQSVDTAPSNGLSEDDVERIAVRVAALVGERLVREVAWEVIPDLAEVIIKDRLRELEGQVE